MFEVQHPQIYNQTLFSSVWALSLCYGLFSPSSWPPLFLFVMFFSCHGVIETVRNWLIDFWLTYIVINLLLNSFICLFGLTCLFCSVFSIWNWIKLMILNSLYSLECPIQKECLLKFALLMTCMWNRHGLEF